MTRWPDINTRLLAGLGMPLLLLLLIAGTSTFSVANTRTGITFYHMSEDAGRTTESLRNNLEAAYPGTFTDTAHVDDLTFDVSGLYNENTYCGFEPVVKRGTQELDDYSLQNQIREYYMQSDRGDRTQTYGDITAVFGEPIYLDTYVWHGDFFGITNCYGTLNKYTLPVDHSTIDATTDIPAKAVQGETVDATVTLTNSWKPLESDLTAKPCINNQYCEEIPRENVQVDRGTTR